VSAKDARAIGAYINFAEEFRNPAQPHAERELVEAARVFHSVHAGEVRTSLLPPLAVHGALADAWQAGKLQGGAFSYVERSDVPVAMAAQVAALSDTPSEQVSVMEILKNRAPRQAALARA
jgi:hypothetical protein